MRALRVLGWVVGTTVLLALLAAAVVLGGLNTDPGRRLAERLLARASGGEISVTGLAGAFPASIRIARLDIRDADGVWLTVEDAALEWSPLRLLKGEAYIDALTASRVEVMRLPVASGQAKSTGGVGNLPVRVDLERLQVARLQLDAAVAGVPVAVSVDGSAQVASLKDAEARLALAQLGGPGRYRLGAAITAAGVQGRLQADEPARGLLSQVAGLPAVGPIAATASLAGPWNAAALALAVSAGPLRANASGTLDLRGMAGEVQVSAIAPAMQPRGDLSWQGISLQGRVRGRLTAPEGNFTLDLQGLNAAGARLADLLVRASGHAGAATLEATATGVRVPGPEPLLFAAAPLHLTATARLDAPDRPVSFSLEHPLARIEGTARTAGALSGEANITLPDLGKLAAAAGVDLKGHTALRVSGAEAADGIHVEVEGTLAVDGGMAPVPALLGPNATIGAAGVLAGADLTLSRLQVGGQVLSVAANGGLKAGVVTLEARVGLSDLAALGGTIQGSLTAEGHANGRTDDLSLSANLDGDVGTAGFPRGPVHASLEAHGLPGNPTGSISAQGTLDGAALTLAADARRAADGTLHATITRADWRSLHADGALDLPPGAVLPLGTMTLSVGRLADFSRLLGRDLSGSVTATLRTEQQDATPVAVLEASARNAGLPGAASVGDAKLTARVRDPIGARDTEARLEVTGLRAGPIGGGLRLAATGKPEALSLALAADLTGVGGGPLGTRAAAVLNASRRSLALNSLSADWKGQTLRLLAPARFSFATGVAVDRARFGIGDAVVEVAGQASPSLDLTLSARNVTPALARAVVPGIDATGQLQADARLGGTPARPTGTIRLSANGLHMRTGPAAGLPAASLTLNATLAGTSARIDVAATAGGNHLALRGTAPLAMAGAMDLHATGTIRLATLNPILAANGRQVRGQLTLDAAIAGTPAAPRGSGTLRVADGEVQDFVLGAHLTAIEAVVQAQGDTIRIASFTARAGKGTISAGGTVGLTAPMPVALTLTARNATPLASDRLTAVLGADLTVRGEAFGRLDVAGAIRIAEADIRIPDSMPVQVAVLQVRRPGQKPPPPPGAGVVIGLDVTLSATGRIFVRGRGLNAELAGHLHLGGTSAAPQPNGSFTLVRGQFSLAGTTLNFTQGKVGFDGSGRLDPTLDFLATSYNGTITANLAITGYASAPKITLSSTPELPQDEVLSWLLFHQASGSLSPLQLAEIAGALAQISGVGGGAGPLDALRSRLGLDQLSLGSGANGTGTAVQAGRYVARGVYVGAKQSTSGNGTQATVQVDLAKGLKLEATAGGTTQNATGASTTQQDQGTSVGLTYQFQY